MISIRKRVVEVDLVEAVGVGHNASVRPSRFRWRKSMILLLFLTFSVTISLIPGESLQRTIGSALRGRVIDEAFFVLD